MRTEAEIRKKLRQVRLQKKFSKPSVWQVLVIDVYLELLEWVLKEKAGRKK